MKITKSMLKDFTYLQMKCKKRYNLEGNLVPDYDYSLFALYKDKDPFNRFCFFVGTKTNKIITWLSYKEFIKYSGNVTKASYDIIMDVSKNYFMNVKNKN